jgi:enoyl-CoA hydratase
MSDIHVRVEGRVGRITLTRPRALNALTTGMVAAIDAAVSGWRDDPAVACVLIDAEGERAFSAGGDIEEVYSRAKAGNVAFGKGFWADEYRLNVKIARYPKPYVALCQGYTMGGGVGVSLHGGHRVVCESSRVAMPECAIGLVPDVGGTDLLADAPGRLGEYLGVIGHRMGPGDAIRAGFADRFVPRGVWHDLIETLVETGDADAVLDFERAPPAPELAPLQPDIDAAFSAPDLASLAGRLEATDWGRAVCGTMAKLSPLSMACTLALVRAARAEPGIEAAVRREYRFTSRSIEQGELMEGIRAAIIDKDRAPKWRDTLASVSPDRIAAMLAPLGPDELSLD